MKIRQGKEYYTSIFQQYFVNNCESWFANMTSLPSRFRVVSSLKCTRMSAIVLSFHWGHEEPPGVDLRAAIVRLEDLRAEIRKYRESADRSEKTIFFFLHQKNPFG